MSVIDQILEKLEKDNIPGGEAPEHKPEMLLIGCVDARKDPIQDLGIEKGQALILRNIAALIRGTSVKAEQRETEAAALEFAVKVMKVKHIAVMGHTHCGGIRAALLGIDLEDIKNYLSPLDEIRKEVRDSGKTVEEQSRILEKEAVKMSTKNLLSYDYIAEAVAKGELEIHGWVLDISNGDLQKVS